jgi:Holliday junction DNA helicase RuvB
MFGDSFRPDALFKILRTCKPGSFILIDEVHKLGDNNSITLYPIIEDSVMYLPSLHNSIKVKPITIIAVTNELSLLKPAFIDRFPLKIELDLYSVLDLAQIITINSTLPIDKSAALFIAGISRGTPRQAIDYIKLIENYAIANKINDITEEVAVLALKSYGIDKFGFNHVHRSIINILGNTYTGQAVGVSTLSNLVGKSQKDLESMFEGYLLERGIVEKTKSGRILTTKGYEILDEIDCT